MNKLRDMLGVSFEEIGIVDPDKEIDGIEVCVSCGEDTFVKKSTPVYQRKFYVEGIGELCRTCYEGVYGTNSGGTS